ncbi:hypothetical protein BAY61_18135 [Prauserella marina]|uniref:DNA-binding transcriptional activator of the SARP family n=1 Tax=Prauserella marina TaxID=530584 RepID=A0A222VRX7_9PSEU|nr:BTAD domain-containing putative transcriptional regulator [Prauserella marina]ASR36602.1 hypothetical protein BAY61_18135 [Prauserella marina]PWV74012.1 DNA-binding SARP family transcriptional activator [Prauserella marina]SDD60883.1 DNA-binding transcriptional activator of the SARP family [Prauserella marina]
MTARLRGVFAALALLAFVAGIPCGLFALGATPASLLPDHWPQAAPISQWPERIWNTLRWAWLTGDLLVTLLVIVAWAGWLLLTLSVTAEVIRQTRHGVRAARGVLARVPRSRWIAGLVAAALVLLSSGTASALPTTASPIVATAPPQPPHQTHTTAVEPIPKPTNAPEHRTPSRNWVDPALRPDCPRILVHKGDTAWGLAEYHLGDGRRFHDIERLNADRIPNIHELHPDDVLLLPPEAVKLPPDTSDAQGSARTVTVEPGDTLSAIAERELGNPEAWPALFDATLGTPQPDGRVLRHPDQLLPGWQIHIPATSNPTPPHPTPPPPPASTPPTPPNDAHDPRQDHGTPVQLPSGGLIGFGVALSIVALLVLVRRRRRARRNPTGSLTAPHHPGPPDPARPGSAIAALDHAVHSSQRDEAEPQDDGHDDGPADTLAAGRRPVWPPPAPVITAHTDTGVRQLDLSAAPGLALTGPGAAPAARAVLAAVLAVDARHPAQALLAASAPAALLADTGDQPALHRIPGVEVIEDEGVALAHLRTELARRTRIHDDQLAADELHEEPGDDPGQPLLLVAATPSPHHRREWATISDHGRPLGIHTMFLGDHGLHDAGDSIHLALDEDGTITAAHGPSTDTLLGARVDTLTTADAAEIWHLLAEARTPMPSHTHHDVGENDRDTSDDQRVDSEEASARHNTGVAVTSAQDGAAVVVRLLGGMRVEAHEQQVRGLRSRTREVLAYLAAHHHGTTADTLREAVLPDQPAARLHEAISHGRSALRKATGASEAMFVIAESGRYCLDPAIITADVWDLEDTLTHARTASHPGTRLEALRYLSRLCRTGAPLEGAPYSWAEPIAEHWRSQAVDALVALACDVRADNPDEALDALAVAITWDPYTEALYRRTIALQRDLGRHDAAHTTYRHLQANLRDIDLEPDPATTALLEKAPIPRR